MPGMAVFSTSSIFGNSGSRSARFLRIEASSAKAAVAKQAARRKEVMVRGRFFMMPSGVERPRGEPALERRYPIDQVQAIVAEIADRRLVLGEQTQQSVGNPQHRRSRRRAQPHVPPQQP